MFSLADLTGFVLGKADTLRNAKLGYIAVHLSQSQGEAV